MRATASLFLALFAALMPSPLRAEDGYDLWLRYRPVEAGVREAYAARTASLVVPGATPTQLSARSELQRGLQSMLGTAVPLRDEPGEGAIVVGTARSSATIAALALPLASLGGEGS